MSETERAQILSRVIETAYAAGRGILGFRGGETGARMKSDHSFVTDADMHADQVIREGLSSYEWPFLSEEGEGTERRGADYIWIVDPLDGTKPFIEGSDEFSVMIGLVERGKPLLSVIYQPATEKLYTALRGAGAFLRTKGGSESTLHVSDIAESSRARCVMSRHHMTSEMDAFVKNLRIPHLERVGSNGIKIGLIAEGRFDILFNPTSKMGEWDMCAPGLILEEAGGKLTGIGGEVLVYNKEVPRNPYGVLATNGALHEEALRAIQNI